MSCNNSPPEHAGCLRGHVIAPLTGPCSSCLLMSQSSWWWMVVVVLVLVVCAHTMSCLCVPEGRRDRRDLIEFTQRPHRHNANTIRLSRWEWDRHCTPAPERDIYSCCSSNTANIMWDHVIVVCSAEQ